MSALARVVSSEWLKIRTVRSSLWFLGGATAIMLLTSLLQADDGDPSAVASTASVIGSTQYLAAAFGILAITAEFASRSITVTFACTPSRTRVLSAKALVVATSVLVAGVAVAGLGLLAAAIRLGELGDLTGDDVALVLRLGVFLALLATVGLGFGGLFRRTAGALSFVLFLLLLMPELLGLLAQRFGWSWLETAIDYTPAPAGYALVQGDWLFGGVLLTWAVGLVAGSAWVLRRRDV